MRSFSPHGVGLKIRDDVCKIDEKPHRHTRQVERNRRGACPSVSSFLPPAGSGRFTLTCLDGGRFESRRDSGWSRRGGLSPDRRRIGDANDDRSHNGRYRGNRQDRLLWVIQSVFRASAHNRFDSSLQITARHPRYASERRSQIQLADLEDAFGGCAARRRFAAPLHNRPVRALPSGVLLAGVLLAGDETRTPVRSQNWIRTKLRGRTGGSGPRKESAI